MLKKYFYKNIYFRLSPSHLFIILSLNFQFSINSLLASGGFDNGTPTAKGKLGLDITINPFNYYKQGQSYIVLSYGVTNKINIHSYYSIPADGYDNYYLGFFNQFIKIKNISLATAIGIRQYKKSHESHLFFPQLLYTFNIYKDIKIGGSIVAIRDNNHNFKYLGATRDISIIFPIVKPNKTSRIIESTNFCIGVFKPILWKPKTGNWHPTYSIDFILNI